MKRSRRDVKDGKNREKNERTGQGRASERERKRRREMKVSGRRGSGRSKSRATGVISHSFGVCLAKSGSSRAEDYGITVSVDGHVSPRGRNRPCLPSF